MPKAIWAVRQACIKLDSSTYLQSIQSRMRWAPVNNPFILTQQAWTHKQSTQTASICWCKALTEINLRNSMQKRSHNQVCMLEGKNSTRVMVISNWESTTQRWVTMKPFLLTLNKTMTTIDDALKFFINHLLGKKDINRCFKSMI